MRTDTRQMIKIGAELGQGLTHGQRQEVLTVTATGAGVQRQALQPRAEHPVTVHWQGTQCTQAFIKIAEPHDQCPRGESGRGAGALAMQV